MTTEAQTNRQDFLRDVAIVAAEGGIGYWSSCTRYRWSKDGSLDNMLPFPELRIVASESPEDFDGELLPGVKSEKTDDMGLEVTITADTIRKGLSLIEQRDDICGSDMRKLIIGASKTNDAGDIDADAADVIVQAGIFGKLVFG
jgi:hypothetical protein